MSFITELSLKRASVVLLIAIALVAGGLYAVFHINQELTPDLDFPLITVITAQPGASPQDVADSVSAPLEAAIANVPGLKNLQSTSADGVSIVVAQFDFGHDMKAAEQEINRQASGVSLPADAQKPQVTRLNLNQTLPVIQLGLSGDLETGELEQIARQELVPRIKAVDGVQAVDISGGVRQQVDIVLDPARMAERGITTAQVSGALRANNISLPSGVVDADGGLLPVRTISQLTSLEAIENLVVGFQSGQPPQPVLVKDIATVSVNPSFVGGISRTNGKPGIGIAVTKTQQGNTVKVAQAVKDIAREAQARLGDRATIETTLDMSTFITESITGLTREGLFGAIAAVAAIWIFLLSFRSTLVTAVSIPLSVMVALVALFWQGFTLNILTLAGLTIAVGRVVDDAIVVLENIFRHVQEGENPDTAARNGAREVATAIFGSTMTTIAVFLPLGFVGGIVGVLFRPFALTVTFALLASLVVALTVVPVLARAFVGRHQLGRRPRERRTLIQRGYTPVLAWALRHRAWTLTIAALLFLASLALLPLIPTTFLPQGEEKQLQVSVAFPPGSGTAQDALARVEEIEGVIAGLPDVALYNTHISLGGRDTGVMALFRALSGQAGRGATITVRLKPDADLDAAKEQARRELGALKDVVASVSSAGMDSMNTQFQVSVLGQDPEAVRAAAGQMLDAIRGAPHIVDVSSTALASQPEVAIRVDPEKALAHGLTAAQVAQRVRELTGGQVVTAVRLGNGNSLDVLLRADPAYLGSLDALGGLAVAPSVPLSSIATIERTQAPTVVTRQNQQASATIAGTVTAASTGEVNREVQRRLGALALPSGVTVEYGGVLQQFRESFNSMFVGIGAAVVIVYIVMVLVMGSLASPFVIMFSLPLASIGALAALAITGRALGLPSLLGMMMLVGIVVTNAIVLIDFVNRLRSQGYSTQEALLEGGRLRVRPVLMTAITTILALIPLSLGLTEGAIIASELATVVIGGLLTSTLLTLVVVPVVYSYFGRMKANLRKETNEKATK